MELRRGLWKTCRVIASETRLKMLWYLFAEGELTVMECSQFMRLSPSNTSFQLKMLRECGLVISRREKMEVFCRAEANSAVEFAPEVLEALRRCHELGVSFKTLIRHATAFTHERRIEILRALRGRSLSALALRDATGMSSSAFCRHLDKLIRRGYVRNLDRSCRIGIPANTLGRTLLKLAT
ncbi:MAG: winged helix-turn-helix transcriptional regulator [Kiritimatiellales bacterium]|nr:winged helix-turn-helix transcriptional regulator [Kiritimatiellota bacterium]MBL7016550.1 winged helix-turn-helix transcriptional regulator [Kiritimatiellales bacterium]